MLYKCLKICTFSFSLIVLIIIAICCYVWVTDKKFDKKLENVGVMVFFDPEKCSKEMPFLVMVINPNSDGIVNLNYKVEAYLDGINQDIFPLVSHTFNLVIYPKSTGFLCEQLTKNIYSNIDYKKLNYSTTVINAQFSDRKNLQKYGKNMSISNSEISKWITEIDKESALSSP